MSNNVLNIVISGKDNVDPWINSYLRGGYADPK
jgi:hypothetical protein